MTPVRSEGRQLRGCCAAVAASLALAGCIGPGSTTGDDDPQSGMDELAPETERPAVAPPGVDHSPGGAGTVPGDRLPTVAIESPRGNTVVQRGQVMTFQARAADDRGVAEVRARWGVTGSTREFVLRRTATAGLWQTETVIDARAERGWRRLSYVATDSSGQRAASAEVAVWVQ